MGSSAQNLLNLIVTVLAFGLVLSLWLIGAFVWLAQRSAQRRSMEARLGLREEESGTKVLRLWRDGEEVTTNVPQLSKRASLREWLDRMRREAGWQAPTHSVVFGVVGGLTLLFVMGLALTGSAFAGVGGLLAGLVIFWTYLKQRISRYSARFDRQFTDALDLASRSLRAGHPLVGAFRVIAEEVPAPVGVLFGEVCQQQSLGVPLEVALRRAANQVGSEDMRLFATSVSIQLRTGGNLADMMDRVAAVIRERMRLAGRVRVLTSQTQLSKRVLLALPIVMFGLLNLISPQYMELLYRTDMGRMLLAVAGVLMLFGAWLMNKMAVLRY